MSEYLIASDDIARVHRRIAETITWCLHARPSTDLRSFELQPDTPFVTERPQPGGATEYVLLPTDARIAIVDRLAAKRATLLDRRGLAVRYPPSDLAGGRLLAADIDLSDWSGLSQSESGLFDVFDIPSWDTWIHLQHLGGTDVLLCWIPSTHLSTVANAVAVNCTSCLRWIDRPIRSAR